MSLVLSESAPRHLAYPAGGLRADLRLLELDEGLLESIRRDGVVIKGAEGEEAMLCTSSKTFLLKVVETTNTLLLLPPPQQVEQGEGDSARPSQSPGAVTLGLPPLLVQAAGPKGRPCLRATATLASHIELVEAAPRLGALPALLGRPYSLEDEQQQQQQEEEEGGYSTEQLLARVQASRAELEAELRRLQAVQLGGMWRLVDEGYLGDLLEMVLMSALQRGWSMDAVPVGEAAAAMVPDGYLPELTHHCLRVFGRPGGQPPPQAAGATVCSQGGGSGSSGSSSSSHCALDREAVALHFARKLLRQRQVWGLGAFMDAWRQAVPFPHEPSPEALRGEALLLQPQDGDGCPEPQLQHFPARLLPAEPAARFAALFRCRPRWTRGELDPYLAGLACPDGEYKEGWDRLTTCLSCGLSAAPGNLWRSEQTVVVNELDKNTGLTKKQWRMRGSSDSCYIQRGMGVLRTRALNNGTFFFTAQICGNNTYGIEALRKYGVVSTPCTPCPTGMVTTAAHGTDIKVASVVQAGGSSAALTNTDGKGYFKVNACVTKPGWGYWEGASQMCPKGTYNGGENRLPCTPCLTGTTTAGMGSLADTECTKQSAGYGTVGETVALCPVGTYGLESRDAGVCEDCPDHTWTPAPGATLQYYTNDTTPGCTLCAPGYGDQLLNSSETTQLTGQPTCELCQDGYFGSVTRADTKCELCPVTRSFTYTYMAEDVVVPLATSPAAAKTVDDCIADFSQTVDGAFYVPWDLTNTDLVAKADAQNLHSCIETCRGVGGCAGVHFDYSNDSCWNWEPTTGAGSTYVALKTLPSMIIAQSVIHPWSMGSGMFQFWRGAAVAGAVASGSEVVAPAPNDVADCLLACSTDNLCWGAQIEGWTNTAAATITACTLYKGTVDPGNPNRSLLKASLAKFTP